MNELLILLFKIGVYALAVIGIYYIAVKVYYLLKPVHTEKSAAAFRCYVIADGNAAAEDSEYLIKKFMHSIKRSDIAGLEKIVICCGDTAGTDSEQEKIYKLAAKICDNTTVTNGADILLAIRETKSK